MSENNKNNKQRKALAGAHEPATVWEHYALHRTAAEKQVEVFDLELDTTNATPPKEQRRVRAISAPTTSSPRSGQLGRLHHAVFGTAESDRLLPDVVRGEDERQKSLVKTRPAQAWKNYVRRKSGEKVNDPEETMMSGALDDGDRRCAVCDEAEKREAAEDKLAPGEEIEVELEDL